MLNRVIANETLISAKGEWYILFSEKYLFVTEPLVTNCTLEIVEGHLSTR